MVKKVRLPILEGDFLELINSSAKGSINKNAISTSNKKAVGVVAASEGYPGSYKKGMSISGIEEAENNDTIVFHAGTKIENNILKTNGGRVLTVTSLSENNILKAKELAYSALSKIHFDGKVYIAHH